VTHKHLAERVKVVHRAWIVPEHKVPKPAETETETGKGFTIGGWFRLPHGVEDLVFLKVGIELVVLPVAHFPHVVRAHEESMPNGPNDIVQHRMIGERSMTTVMSDDKDSREQSSLDGPVKENEQPADDLRRCQRVEVKEDGESDGDEDKVTDGIVHRSGD